MKYIEPEMKVLELAATDVIVCSGDGVIEGGEVKF